MFNPYYQHNGITIYHGDCRDILQELSGIDTIITDPYYGINHDTDYRRFTGGVNAQRSIHKRIQNDDSRFNPAHLLHYRRLVLWGANCYSNFLPIGSWLIWDKRTPFGNKNVMSDAEVAWMNHGHGLYLFNHTWDGFNRASERGSKVHPTQKPVILMEWCITKAKPQGIICDPYMGSGSTLRAAKNLGFECIGIELEESYCRIAVERLRQENLLNEGGTPSNNRLHLTPKSGGKNRTDTPSFVAPLFGASEA